MSGAREWLSAVAVLTRAELLRLVRTEEVWRYLLLPALLLLPAVVFGAVLVVSLRGAGATVAVPPTLPAELDIVEELEAQRLDVVVRDDPFAAWERGEVDGAVVSVVEGTGVPAARRFEGRGGERWTFEIVADDEEVERALDLGLEGAGRDWLDDQVAMAGGEPLRDVTVVQATTLDIEEPFPIDPARGVAAYAVFTAGTVAFFFLALPVVSDRREGVTEAYRVLPVPATAPLWARLFALLALQVAAGALVVGNIALLLAPLLRGEIPGMPLFADLPGVIAAVVFVDALHVAVGVYAPNAKAANSASGFAVFCALSLLLYGLLGEPPAWVPVAGVFAAAGVFERVVAVVVTVAAAAAVIGVCGRLLATRVRLVLPGLDA